MHDHGMAIKNAIETKKNTKQKNDTGVSSSVNNTRIIQQNIYKNHPCLYLSSHHRAVYCVSDQGRRLVSSAFHRKSNGVPVWTAPISSSLNLKHHGYICGGVRKRVSGR